MPKNVVPVNSPQGPTVADYLAACYPCLFLRSQDSSEAQTMAYSAVKELGADVAFGVWKSTKGLRVGSSVDASFEEDKWPQEVGINLLEAIKHVGERQSPIVAVFHNVRQFVSQPQFIQTLVDATDRMRINASHIIFVGPSMDLPPELLPVITFIDVPLPSKQRIEKMYKDMIVKHKDQLVLPAKKEDVAELIRKAAHSAVGLDALGAENALALSMAVSERIDLSVIQAQKKQEVKKSDVLEFFACDETIDTLGGFDLYKEWLSRRQRAFTEEASRYGLPYPKGVLIVGGAGQGKSLCAKITAIYLGLPLLRLDLGKIYRSLVGESEAAIRQALAVVEAVAPVVVWIDEIEKSMAGFESSGSLDSGVSARVVSTILTWRQETKAPVFMALTANDVTTLPAMVYRKGRIDEVWATDLPSMNERAEIFKIHLKKVRRDPDKFNVALLSKKSEQFTGAEIEGVVNDGLYNAFDNKKEVETEDILKSIGETVPQAIRSREDLLKTREWCKTRARAVSSSTGIPQTSTNKVRAIHNKTNGGK